MIEFISFIDNLITYEKEHGVQFDSNGFPTFTKDMFYQGDIDTIVPYEQRKNAKNRTAICFYEHDKYLYRKLSMKKIKNIAKELTKYCCFVGYDLSIFIDFSCYAQSYSILSNLVIDMYLVLQGNKLIPNIRNSSIDYHYVFKEAKIVCCGTIGCTKCKEKKTITIDKIKELSISNPNKTILTYGPLKINGSNLIQIDNYRRWWK